MQTKVLTLLMAASVLLTGCMDLGNPYADNLNQITVQTVYPAGVEGRQGAKVTIEGVSTVINYTLYTGTDGTATTHVPNGIFRITVSDQAGSSLYNGSVDKLVISGEDMMVQIPMIRSVRGQVVIKELYCGGCSKEPKEGTYQSDQYVIVHNNDIQTAYLDGLCLGTLSPYNSNANNPWVDKDGNLPDFAPVIQAVWRIGGNGHSFPLEPGEDAVICFRGAIDHTAQYPRSVNLNKPDYFVCYNPVYFPNTTYHPIPGNQIREDHYLEVVIKTGQANAYTLSINSPVLILFRPQDGADIYDFVAQPENLIQVPGSSIDRVVATPLDWIEDGVEVFNGSSSSNNKRLDPSVDAGHVLLSTTFKGHTLRRSEDIEATKARGFEVLMDTNNSTNDFYESFKQSLSE